MLPNESLFNKDHWMNKYCAASAAGAIRGAFSLIFEHPFDAIKTGMQAEQKSAGEVGQRIFAEKGFKGFYSGAIPNGFRICSKQAYRWPLMLALPNFFERNIPKSFQERYSTINQIATGLTIAHAETFFICPFERLKVYLMTTPDKESGIIRQFFNTHRGQLWKEATRGLNAVYLRQMTSWVSFLVADKKFKDMERERTNTKELSYLSLLLVSFQVGLANTAVNMPFDVAKTEMQKKNYTQERRIFEVMKEVFKHHGVKGLYTGCQIRMIQYMIQAGFTVNLLEYFDRIFKGQK